MPRSTIRSLVPISTRSTPSTATISSIASSAAFDSNCTITSVASLSAGRVSAAGKVRNCSCGRLAHSPCRPGRAHPRRYYPERPAVEHARDVLRRIRRHAHQRRDPRLERHDADLAGRLHGEARVLQVDVERVEPRALGDAHDLDARYQPRGHRRHQLAARELLPDWIADDVADLDRHADASLAEEAGLPLDGGGLRRGEEPEQSLRALRLPGGDRDAA